MTTICQAEVRAIFVAKTVRTFCYGFLGIALPVYLSELGLTAAERPHGLRDEDRSDLRLTNGRHVLSISSGGGVPMNPVERVLYRELAELLDRLAASVPEGSLEQIRASSSTLKARLDEAELSVAAVRAGLLEGYGRWRRALEDVENLWALAAWRSTAAEEPAEKAAALAA